ncbi:uncharacterized protein LOC105164000 [Sesamum indicum]|uniref:Uncharacterized protein LOC105164000 n=1 Tax=Sesamum indicum TaxID=4182 RepID=A0A6I9TJ47_SESIN|nr:uncharacterized protein LOC105164000 [Sesamum indicum]
MTAVKHPDTASYGQPLLSEPQASYSQPPQYVIVLPPYLPPYRRRVRREPCWGRLICCAAVLLILVAAGYLLWPSDPELSVVRLNLDRLHFDTRPQISLDLTLDTTIKVRNKDFYSLDYDSLIVGIGYRGRRLGLMTSDGGHIRARGSSYLNSTLQLDAVEMLSDAILLLEDLARGSITFDTVSETSGKLRIFFFHVPLKAKIMCEVVVNTRNQTITHHSCHP